MTLHVYDLDKTLIHGDSNELWHEYLLEIGILNEEFIKEDRRLMGLYAKGELDMDVYLEFAINSLGSVSLNKISSLLDEYLQTKIKPIIYDETKELIKNNKNIIIISASPEFIVKPIANFLEVQECIGMKLIEKNGYLTGKYEKPLSYKEGKVTCLKNYLEKNDLNPQKIVSYSDSINDLPLLEYSHEAHCVNPDKKLEKIAMQNAWQIHRWSK